MVAFHPAQRTLPRHLFHLPGKIKAETMKNTNTDYENKIKILRSAIEDGEASGYIEDFDFEKNLKELKERKHSLSKD